MTNLRIYLFILFVSLVIRPVSVLYSQDENLTEVSMKKDGIRDSVVKILSRGEYFQTLHNEIGRAKVYIYVAMYMIIRTDKEGHPVKALVDDLIKARKRGVDVKVILEDDLFWRSHNAYKALLDGGIWVRLDSPQTLLHSKVVIIDGVKSILGSTNWSKRAFFSNYEASVLIESKDAAKRLAGDFLK